MNEDVKDAAAVGGGCLGVALIIGLAICAVLLPIILLLKWIF